MKIKSKGWFFEKINTINKPNQNELKKREGEKKRERQRQRERDTERGRERGQFHS